MKSTEHFKAVILQYLQKRAETDSIFAPRFANPEKNIDDCTTYILNTCQNSGCNGFTDEEVFGMAVHYYDDFKEWFKGYDLSKPMAIIHFTAFRY